MTHWAHLMPFGCSESPTLWQVSGGIQGVEGVVFVFIVCLGCQEALPRQLLLLLFLSDWKQQFKTRPQGAQKISMILGQWPRTRDESAAAHKSPFMDKGMLQYLLLTDTEPLPFITTRVFFFFLLLRLLALSSECDPVNANKQLSAFVIQKQRHLAIVSPPVLFLCH